MVTGIPALAAVIGVLVGTAAGHLPETAMMPVAGSDSDSESLQERPARPPGEVNWMTLESASASGASIPGRDSDTPTQSRRGPRRVLPEHRALARAGYHPKVAR